jgi:glycosyltransferase involved in cell wall biosynthesis
VEIGSIRKTEDDPSSDRRALVSIGLPVFNGERYLKQALDALLAQDYQNLEFVISDNASTDRTAEICREYEARDPRIRYAAVQSNIGAVNNFNRVFDLCRGEYFMWAAHDDLWHPSFVSKCVARLEDTPGAALVCTNVRLIDEDGNQISEQALVGATHPDRAARVRQFLSCRDLGYPAYGLARRETFQRALPLKLCWGSDFIFLTKMYLSGTVEVVPEPLISYRVFQHKTPQDVAVTLGLPSQRTMLRNHVNIYLEVLRAIAAADLPRWERTKIELVAAVTFGKHWPLWIKTSLADYAYPKYLLPAIKNRELGNRKLAAYWALRAIAANPFYLFSGAWVIAAEAAIGPRLSEVARRFARRFGNRKEVGSPKHSV